MPVATPQQYAEMLDAAQKGGYAYPAINVTSLATINGALKAFAEAGSDGIIQVSTGGGSFASGLAVADEAYGAIVLAEATHRLAVGSEGLAVDQRSTRHGLRVPESPSAVRIDKSNGRSLR